MQTFREWVINESVGMIITAYHCGSNFDTFSTKHSGTGEGLMVLGPGIYFVTEESYARLYCKHHRTPDAGLYEADIDTTNFYCFGSAWNRNPEQSKVVSGRVNAIAQKLGYEDGWALGKYVSSLTYGNPPIGGIVKLLGKMKALEEFIANGIQGGLEYLPGGITELAVYDSSVIKLKKKTVVSAAQARPKPPGTFLV